MDYEKEQRAQQIRYIKLGVGGVALFLAIVLILINLPIVVVNAGNRGVVFSNTSGVQDRILDEGVHFRIPFVESVKELSVKVQKNEVQAAAASKDLQTVSAHVVVNWHLDPNRVNKIYQNIGTEKDVFERVISPSVNEVLKAATAKYTAEELLTKRAQLKFDVDQALKVRLADYHIALNDVSIVNLDFSPEFNKAIEAKAAAVQNAQKAQNDLARIKIEAEQRVTTANAEAEAIRIKASALKENPDLVNLNAVEKWDGKMPHYFGGGVLPFLNVGQ